MCRHQEIAESTWHRSVPFTFTSGWTFDPAYAAGACLIPCRRRFFLDRTPGYRESQNGLDHYHYHGLTSPKQAEQVSY